MIEAVSSPQSPASYAIRVASGPFLPILLFIESLSPCYNCQPTMSTLHVQLFHTLTVTTAAATTLDLGSPTTRSLFAYLVLHRG